MADEALNNRCENAVERERRDRHAQILALAGDQKGSRAARRTGGAAPVWFARAGVLRRTAGLRGNGCAARSTAASGQGHAGAGENSAAVLSEKHPHPDVSGCGLPGTSEKHRRSACCSVLSGYRPCRRYRARHCNGRNEKSLGLRPSAGQAARLPARENRRSCRLRRRCGNRHAVPHRRAHCRPAGDCGAWLRRGCGVSCRESISF